MHKGRFETFSDGVIAIIITIMVLELKVPHSPDLEALVPVLPVFLCYLMSFVYLSIYWNNHHHMLQAVHHVNGAALWANLHLLFWLSMVPFVTEWMGENSFAPIPVAMYGVVLLFAAVAYYILARVLVAGHGADSALAKALGNDFKGRISVVLYIAAVGIAFWNRWAACAIYVFVAVMWLVPDRRFEKILRESTTRK